MNTYFDWLDDYMEGKLSPQQRLDFEQATEQDEKLRHAVENYPLLKQLSASLIEDETRQMLKDLENKKAVPNNTRRLSWWLAAAVFVGLLAYMGKSVLFTTPNNEKLRADLYIKPQAEATRGAISDTLTLTKAIDLFDRNHLTEALPFFQAPAFNDSLQTLSNRYLAHIYLRTEKLTLADSLFTSLENASNYHTEALYNRMLIALLLHKKEEARRIFKLLDKSQFSESQLKKVEGYLR
ncbi:MAG: hypothetical protein KBF35_00320 [Saprospiraceae bacterium]|nr:hypothetical protein [Saprospiraceae bacterium]